MRSQYRSHDEAAFTLAELLVAVAVAGLAGSILVGMLTFVEYIRAESMRRDSEWEGILAMEHTIRLLIDGTPPYIPGNSLSSAISGDEHEVAMISTGLPIISLPQAKIFRLRSEPAASGSDVVLLWRDDTGQVQRIVLAQGITEMALSYLPHDDNRLLSESHRKGQWYHQWRAESGRLSALRVAFRFDRGSSSRVLMFPIEADLPAACLRTPQQAGCAQEGYRP